MSESIASTATGGAKMRHTSSIVSGGSTAVSRKPVQAEFDFSLGTTKAKVYKTLDDTIPATFKKFFNSSLYDRILHTLLLYFITLYQYEWLVKAMERARRTHLDGYNPYTVALRLQEQQEELLTLRRDLSPLYSEIILKHSTYEKPQQDRLFFEALYNTLTDILDESMTKLSRRADIEIELGSLFRSRHFNLSRRRNEPQRSVDTLTIKELYALKHETANRALNAKMLTSLYLKPPSIAVQVASVTNSPLITQYIMSPIVARSMMKDPAQRSTLLTQSGKQPHSANATMSAPNTHAGFTAFGMDGVMESPMSESSRFNGLARGVATIKGADLSTLRENLSSMKPSASTEAVAGLVPPDSTKGSRQRGTSGFAPPESAGLVVDEVYTHLALLKRYVLHGPTLGMASATHQGGNVIGNSSSSSSALVASTPARGSAVMPLPTPSGKSSLTSMPLTMKDA